MELLSIDAQLNFKQHSRRNHYINEEITAEFIHFNAICDVEVEKMAYYSRTRFRHTSVHRRERHGRIV